MLVIGFDTETEAFSPGNMAPEVVCLSWWSLNKSELIVGKGAIRLWLNQQLKREEIVLAAHNAAYDWACIIRTFPELIEQVFRAYADNRIICTDVRERLLDIAQAGSVKWALNHKGKRIKATYSLAGIAKKRWDIEVSKGSDTWRTRFGELKTIPFNQWPQEAIDYAKFDAELVQNLWIDQKTRADQLNYDLPTQFEDTRAAFGLHLAHVRGVKIDGEQVRKIWAEAVEGMESCSHAIESSGIGVRHPETKDLLIAADVKPLPKLKMSTKAIRSLVEELYPGKAPRTSPSARFPDGQIKTSEEVVAKCGSGALDALKDFQKLQKVANTYLSKYFVPYLHHSYNAVGAATDRTSAFNPNTQNLPKMPGVRECIIARQGFVFVACDFDSQEMRTLAEVCLRIIGRSKLAERYQADVHFDPHLEFAATVAKVSVDEARSLLADGDEQMAGLRQRCKVANFGFPGGMAAHTFVSYAQGWGVEINADQAEWLKQVWFEQWPEMGPYFEYVKQIAGKGFGSYGRTGVCIHPVSHFRRAAAGFSDTANSGFQTLAAHASKAALWEVTRKCFTDTSSFLYGSRPVLFVHDEVIIEAPEFAAHLVAKEMPPIMVEAMQKWTPNVPCAASAHLMRAWTKKAHAVYDNTGKLIPWEDRID